MNISRPSSFPSPSVDDGGSEKVPLFVIQDSLFPYQCESCKVVAVEEPMWLRLERRVKN